MSVLTIVQKAARRTSLFKSVPTTVVGNSDKTVALALELLYEIGEEIKESLGWQYLVSEQTFSTVASQKSYVFDTIVTGGDFNNIVPNTFYDQTNEKEVKVVDFGEYQNLQSVLNGATGLSFFVVKRNNGIDFYPTPTASYTMSFFYRSDQWIESSGGTGQDAFLDDSDVTRANEHLMYLGLVYKLEEAEKVPSDISYENFINRLQREKSKSKIAQRLIPAYGDMNKRNNISLPVITGV